MIRYSVLTEAEERVAFRVCVISDPRIVKEQVLAFCRRVAVHGHIFPFVH